MIDGTTSGKRVPIASLEMSEMEEEEKQDYAREKLLLDVCTFRKLAFF
jgi:hypothetical protein